jgi:alginate O-acetyltransferase complex protein AlgI
MSLSSWFRDYVYIPLGGNRVSKLKWIRNLFCVWFLTGFWHGASWNFIIWGLYFGILLVLEKIFLGKLLEKTKIVKYIYTSIIVIISFLIFSVETVPEIITSLKNMFLLSDIPFTSLETTYYLRSYLVLLIISIIGATPLFKNIIRRLKETKLKIVIDILEPIYVIVLLVLSTAFLIDASFNPFLYFRF